MERVNGMCCDSLNFAWQSDSEGQVLSCASCGARWEPRMGELGENANIRLAWEMLREKLGEKKTWSQGALKDLMLDCLIGASE